MNTSRLGKQAGYSLVEIVLGLTILSSLAGVALLATNGGIGSYRTARSGGLVETKIQRAASRLVREFIGSSAPLMGPAELNDVNFGTPVVTFQAPTGMGATGPLWGLTQGLALELAPGELDDGIDNNGNGVADEQVLVLTRDVNNVVSAQRVVLCSNIRETFIGEIPGNLIDDNGNGVTDEQGFNAVLAGNVLTIRLCVEVQGADGNTVTRELTTSTRMRN